MNLKTTAMGILTILSGVFAGAVLLMKGQQAEGATAILTSLTAGVGLMLAKDADRG